MDPKTDYDVQEARQDLITAYLERVHGGVDGRTTALVRWLQLAAMAAHGQVNGEQLAEMANVCLGHAPALLSEADLHYREQKRLEDEGA